MKWSLFLDLTCPDSQATGHLIHINHMEIQTVAHCAGVLTERHGISPHPTVFT